MHLFKRKKKQQETVLQDKSYEDWLQQTIERRVKEHKAPQIAFNRKHLPIPFDLRILAISDTHNRLRAGDIPSNPEEKFDVCLLLGDISLWDMEIIKDAVLNKIPIYSVKGNHDSVDEFEDDKIINIHGKVVEVKGVRIAGMEGSVAYKPNSAHQHVMFTDEESSEIAKYLPPADIFISHDSPKYLHGNWNFAHSGLQGVTDYLFANNVPLHLHGHHHVNLKHTLKNGTLSICCYGVREIYTKDL